MTDTDKKGKKAHKLHFLTMAFIAIIVFASQLSAIDLISPEQGHWTRNPQVQFKLIPGINVSQNLTNYSISDCRLLIDSVIANATMQNSSENSTTTYYFIQAITEGAHTWEVNCTSGNITESSEKRNITLDASPPVVTIIYPRNEIYNDEIQEIIFLATDNLDKNLDCVVKISSAAFNTQQNIQAANNTNTSLSVSLSEGDYNLSVSCEDNAHNYGVGEAEFSIRFIDIFFQISFDKEKYTIGENAKFQIAATNKSDVYITIVAPNGNSYVWDYKKQLYPKTEAVPYTKKAGKYKVTGTMKYEGSTISLNKEILIESNLGATITGNTNLEKGETATLKATVSGGIPPLSIKWKLSNSTIVKGSEFTRKYTSKGTYKEVLAVNDSEGNYYEKAVEVKVKEKFSVQIKLLDDESGEAIEGALVEIGSFENKTNKTGFAGFSILEGNWKIYATKKGYRLYENNITVSQNETKTIRIKKVDSEKPKIKLITEDQKFFDGDVKIEFSVSDAGKTDCSLYLNDGQDEWYSLKEKIKGIANDGKQSFTLKDLTHSSYKWKIECVDEDGNNAFSEERFFEVLDENTKWGIARIDDSLSEIEGLLKYFGELGREELEASQALGIIKKVEDAKKEVSRAKRDISNLPYRKDMSHQEKEQKKEELQESADKLISQLPKGINVLDSKSFIKYADERDVERALQEAVGEEYKKIFSMNKKLQESITVTTNLKIVELEYKDKKDTITLVYKKVSYTGEKGPYFLVELIPKEFAQSSDEIKILNEHQVLNKDPVIRLNLDDEIIYYVNKKVDLSLIDKASTIIISKQSPESSSPTGFSIKGITSSISGSLASIIIFVFALSLVIGLVVVRSAALRKQKNRYEKHPEKQKPENLQQEAIKLKTENHKKPKESPFQKIKGMIASAIPRKNSYSDAKMDALIREAFEFLGSDNTQSALDKYYEIAAYYGQISQSLQQSYLEHITQLCYSIDVNTVRQMIYQLEYCLAKGQVQNSMAEFSKIENIYSCLPDEYKHQVSEQYFQIYGRVEEIRSMIIHNLKLEDSPGF